LPGKVQSFFIRHLPVPIREWLVKVRNIGRKIPDKATVNGETFKVVPDKFWIRFNEGEWEPDLNRFFSNHVRPERTVLDIGAWQGPSVFMALSYNAKKIIAVEANPGTCTLLRANIQNNGIEDVVDLQECCISDKTGEDVSFGPIDNHVRHTSVNGIGGSGFTIRTVSFTDFLGKLDLSDINIVKIDVEGGERLLNAGLKTLSDVPDTVIYLAMHPPFWPDKRVVAEDFMTLCTFFDLFDSKENPLAPETLWGWMLSDEKTIYPGRSGRFFDVILKSKR
jgi:FkbM family methyltransferase